MSAAMTGRLRGDKNPMFGKILSESTKEKMSLAKGITIYVHSIH
jgi:putative sterol carrier protein